MLVSLWCFLVFFVALFFEDLREAFFPPATWFFTIGFCSTCTGSDDCVGMVGSAAIATDDTNAAARTTVRRRAARDNIDETPVLMGASRAGPRRPRAPLSSADSCRSVQTSVMSIAELAKDAPMTQTLAAPGVPGPTAPPSPMARIRLLAADIKIAHSVFALPFAIFGAFLANTSFGLPGNTPRFLGKLALVVVCMVLARTWAMLFNRIVDRRFDAQNPRTTRRALASGSVTLASGWITALASAALFIAATGGFLIFFANPWPLILSVPVLAWIGAYSLTKRFTLLCHFFLGGALGASPIAACIAIEPANLSTQPAIWGVALMVLVWVAGFDMIYALQDIEFDRRTGLSSIPARLGPRGALWVSRALHTLAILFLLASWAVDGRLSWLFLAGICVAAGLLIAEHVVLIRNDTARTGRGLDMAFFTLNGVVSCVLGTLGCLDVIL